MNRSQLSGITFVVPVRSGSTRVLEKNTRHFADLGDGHSVSLLEWKLAQLLHVLHPSQILVSSDAEAVLNIASDYKVLTHKRDARLATPDAPFAEFVGKMAEVVSSEHLGWCTVTSPFIGPEAIRRFLSQYFSLTPAERDSGLITVNRVQSYALFRGAPLNFELGGGHERSQELVPVEFVGWGLCARPTERVKESKYMYGLGYTGFELDSVEGIDIDNSIQFEIASTVAEKFWNGRYGLAR